MRTKRLLALAMAGAMMTGAFTTAMPVLAEDNNTTTVSFTVAPKNTYTMTVPANTNLKSDGTATALEGGVTVSSENDIASNYAVIVTPKSNNGWKLKADGKNTEISYGLYSDEDCNNNIIVDYNFDASAWDSIGSGMYAALKPRPYKIADDDSDAKLERGIWFMSDEANAGKTRVIYAKVDTTDSDNWASGTYSDIITFEAEAAEYINFTVEDKQTNVVHKYTVRKGTYYAELSRSDQVDGQIHNSDVYTTSGYRRIKRLEPSNNTIAEILNPKYQFAADEECWID